MSSEDLVLFLHKLVSLWRRKTGTTLNINQGRMKTQGLWEHREKPRRMQEGFLYQVVLGPGCSFLLSIYHMPCTSLSTENNSQIYIYTVRRKKNTT